MKKEYFRYLFILCTLMLIACRSQKETANVSTPTAMEQSTPTVKPLQTIENTSTPFVTSTSEYSIYEINPSLMGIVDDLPDLATSTSTKPIWIEVLCWTFTVPCDWTNYTLRRPYGNNIIQPEFSYEYREEFTTLIAEKIVATGTHEAYIALIEGQADIILVARAPSETELAAAESQGVALDIQPVALDAFVFIVNVQNPADNLSIEQVQDIYSGKITNWQDVGGLDQEIHPYQREADSGSQELMNTLVMKDKTMIDAPEMIQYSMAGPFIAIGQSPGNSEGDIQGLGYTVYFYAQNMALNDDIEFIGINGVEPTFVTIANGRYPLTSDVYVVIRNGEPINSSVVELRNWLLSDEGQRVIGFSGYVPIR